jgi:hypothetical protein
MSFVEVKNIADVGHQQIKVLKFKSHLKVLLSISICCVIVIITILGCLSTPLPLKARQTIPNHITYSQYNVTEQLITSKILQAKLLATNLENILNKSASILEITSGYSEVKIYPT